MTSWHWYEYILKGLFLGLWVFFALQIPADGTAARVDIAWVVGWVAAGLLVGLLGGSVLQMTRGVRPWHNWLAFPLLVLLESPTFVYGGILGGLTLAVLSGAPGAEPWAGPLAGVFGLSFDDIRHLTSRTLPEDDPRKGRLPGDWLGYCVVGGALLGYALYRFRQITDAWRRFAAGLAIAAVAVYLIGRFVSSEATAHLPSLSDPAARFNLGLYILLGLPFFYLLTFCGEAEESEAEIMALCAALGASLHLMDLPGSIPRVGAAVTLLLPVTVYFIYATWVMPGLRVFKHVLRGYAYLNLGRLRLALAFFRRALELDPASPLARQGLTTLHYALTPTRLDHDPELLAELDFSLCLDRAAALLMPEVPPPRPEDRAEAERFLNLVAQRAPAYLARVDYLRTISLLHAKDYDGAAATLARLLNPETPGYDPEVRRQVLFDAWDLALRLHPKLVERLGFAELNRPGRRMEAIAAVERQLRADPNHPVAREYRTLLYAQLSEGEFMAAAAHGLPQDFSYEYVEQLGLALVDDPDPQRRERGMGYLRIAARGLPARAPGLYAKLAAVCEAHGDADAARKALESVKRAGQAVGPRQLAADQRACYLEALRQLAARAEARGDELAAAAAEARSRGDEAGATARQAEAHQHYEAAIADLRQYLEDGGSAALDTYRRLAGLYAKTHDALNALLMTETGLTYDSTDADLLAKRDSYYYSVEPQRLEKVKDQIARWFDVGYCVRKATALLNAKTDDPDILDWADHLTRLAQVMKPDSHAVRLARARVLLRRGDRQAGVQILEDLREADKGSGDEQDAWYAATKLLGQLYLEEFGRPDLALKCFLDYRDYHKSGADTLYQIARCYEALGDPVRAAGYYNQVTGYEGHPLYWDAKDALRRLGRG